MRVLLIWLLDTCALLAVHQSDPLFRPTRKGTKWPADDHHIPHLQP
jgi:hypothetical protein